MARITVEDCLEKEPNRFLLVLLAAYRAKQLLSGAEPLIDDKRNNRPIVVALREIAAGKVRFKTEEEIEQERKEREREKLAAEKKKKEATEESSTNGRKRKGAA